ncbi:uncharacterized protein (TIGR02246 family) [Herbihabitans rhizosphaerae]|uniref:Uncharacterized protein (TIGR02246 family) n=1 Tax=Herbihabitans rhizosphaerae TaxID=1872711 RepID=A0A4Q7L6F2_9PSEU|nr:nuclear transport factor 2 family protein [Herbihabitans rhizosphaerae]RZS44884.1 uncharacterized protein (TIGR02246 family) [Herbihabitans rhizosphaerae]
MSQNETAAIRRTVTDAEHYQVDPEPFVALHTSEAIIVNIAGRRVLGRDKIHEAMTAALRTPLAQVLTKIEIEDIRFASPDVAIVTCVKHVSDERDTAPKSDSLPTRGSLIYVMVKDGDDWRIASAQTTPIVES